MLCLIISHQSVGVARAVHGVKRAVAYGSQPLRSVVTQQSLNQIYLAVGVVPVRMAISPSFALTPLALSTAPCASLAPKA